MSNPLLLNQTLEAFERRAPRAMQVPEEGFDDATTVLNLPKKYRRRLRTINGLERLNKEIRRRERVIRIFPNRESVIRLISSLLMEIDEKWATGREYLDIDEYLQWQKGQKQNYYNDVTYIRS